MKDITLFKTGILFAGHRPRCDARSDTAEHGVPPRAILFALRKLIKKFNRIFKTHLKPLKIKVDSLMMGESICHLWVNYTSSEMGLSVAVS